MPLTGTETKPVSLAKAALEVSLAWTPNTEHDALLTSIFAEKVSDPWLQEGLARMREHFGMSREEETLVSFRARARQLRAAA